jgi:hypothetical protein
MKHYIENPSTRMAPNPQKPESLLAVSASLFPPKKPNFHDRREFSVTAKGFPPQKNDFRERNLLAVGAGEFL